MFCIWSEYLEYFSTLKECILLGLCSYVCVPMNSAPIECLVKLSVMLSISIQMSNRLIFFDVDNIVCAVNMVDIVEVVSVRVCWLQTHFFRWKWLSNSCIQFTMTFHFQGKCHCAMQFSSFFSSDKALYCLTIQNTQPNEILYTYT